MLDLCLGSIALLLFSPLMLLCAILVKCSDGGKVIYSQERVGQFGHIFRVYKFRTMRSNAEQNGVQWAEDDDPRILRFCRWMRVSHVDELPQLINVLFGSMSLVGPRPERTEIYMGLDINNCFPIAQRLDAKPGITGLAQIWNGYDTTLRSFKRKLRLDLLYIRRYHSCLDIWIIVHTVRKFWDHQAR
ncbi:MAG: sugar transferase [Phycisphaerales bacterium]|nr:sugar transferase [Phycisphaerales bacterium]MBT7170716.1 sugar transferase [Phycisphaerales bacterium]